MKKAVMALGVLGMMVVVFAIVGRFHYAPTICWGGFKFSAGSVLLFGNTIMITAILLRVLFLQEKNKEDKQ